MGVNILDTVVLEKDLAEYGLKRGDVGAVVELYPSDGIEVEFVTGAGHTQALVTLKTDDIRPVGAADILSVRQVTAA